MRKVCTRSGYLAQGNSKDETREIIRRKNGSRKDLANLENVILALKSPQIRSTYSSGVGCTKLANYRRVRDSQSGCSSKRAIL